MHACLLTHMPSHTHTHARTHLLFLTHTHATHTHTHTIRTHIPYVHTFSHARPLTRPLTHAFSFPPPLPPSLSPPRRRHCLRSPPHCTTGNCQLLLAFFPRDMWPFMAVLFIWMLLVSEYVFWLVALWVAFVFISCTHVFRTLMLSLLARRTLVWVLDFAALCEHMRCGIRDHGTCFIAFVVIYRFGMNYSR